MRDICVIYQACHCHSSYSSGDRSDKIIFFKFIEIAISIDLSINFRKSYIDYCASGLYHFFFYESGNSGSTNDDIRFEGMLRKVLGVDVTDRHGRTMVYEKE